MKRKSSLSFIKIRCLLYFTVGILSITIIACYCVQQHVEPLCEIDLKIVDKQFSMEDFFIGVWITTIMWAILAFLSISICDYFVKIGKHTTRLCNIFYLLLLGIITLILSIIGFIIYEKLTTQCEHTSIGKALLIWCIVSIVFMPSFCLIGSFVISQTIQTNKNNVDLISTQNVTLNDMC